MPLQLDGRLAAIAELVRPGAVVADIGTDHGYLVCSLVSSGRCPRGYACDINPKPLSRAERTVREQGLGGKVETVLTDGLGGLPWQGIGDFVLAGMGGDLIGEILEAAPWTRSPAGGDRHFVLQPMTKADSLRRYLCGRGFEIREERAVEAGRFVYTVLSVEFTGIRSHPGDRFYWTGRLWERDDPAARAYLDQVRTSLLNKAAGLRKARVADTAAADRWQGLAEEIGQRLEGRA